MFVNNYAHIPCAKIISVNGSVLIWFLDPVALIVIGIS